MKTDPNAPAYSYGYCTADGQCRIDESGLTIREHFAAMALQGLLTVYNDNEQNPIVPNEANVNYMAKLAVKAADALIQELNK